MIIGYYKNIEYRIWKDSKIDIYYWRWGQYGAQVVELPSCYSGIRRAAGDWSKDKLGNWTHSQEEISCN